MTYQHDKKVDDDKIYFGKDDDYSIYYGSSNDEFKIKDEINAVSVLRLPKNSTIADVLSSGGVHDLGHASLSGLGNDDHTHYLKINGKRAMTGSLDMGDNNIKNVGDVDGVNVSSFKSNYDSHKSDSSAHHEKPTVGTGLSESSGEFYHSSPSVHESGGSLEISHNNLNLGHDDHHGVGTGIKWDDDDNIAHDSASVHEDGGSLEISHNNLAINSDDHHTRPSAGDGLTDDSDTFNINVSDFAGSGLQDDGSDNLELTDDTITVAGNSVSLGSSTNVNHDDLSSIGHDDHHDVGAGLKWDDSDNVAHDGASVHESGGDLEISHNNLAINSDDHHSKTITLDELNDSDINDINVDTSGNRPSSGTSGRLFIETDTGRILYDNGDSWIEVGLSESQISLANLSSNAHSDLGSMSYNDHHGVGNGLEWDDSDNVAISSDSIGTDELDLSITPTWSNQHKFDSGIDIRGDLVDDDNSKTIWDYSNAYIPVSVLQSKSVTITSGTGMTNGGSVSLGNSVTIDHASASVHEDGGALEISHNNLNLGHDDHHGVGTGLTWDDSDNVAVDTSDASDGDVFTYNSDGSISWQEASGGGEKTVVHKSESYTTDGEDTILCGIDISLSYTDNSFTPSEDDKIIGITWNTAGTKMYAVGNNNDKVYEFSTSNAFDVSDLSYTGNSLDVSGEIGNPQDIYITPKGDKLYVQEPETVYRYDLSTDDDLSSASYSDDSYTPDTDAFNIHGMTFSRDGKVLYLICVGTDEIYEHSLSTAWDITTASFTGDTFDVSDFEYSGYGLSIDSKGKVLAMGGHGGSEDLHIIKMKNAYKINSAYHEKSISLSESSDPDGVYFDLEKEKLIISYDGDNTTYEYKINLSRPTITLSSNDISTSGKIINIVDAYGNASNKNIVIKTDNDAKINDENTMSIDTNYGSLTLQSDGYTVYIV